MAGTALRSFQTIARISGNFFVLLGRVRSGANRPNTFKTPGEPSTLRVERETAADKGSGANSMKNLVVSKASRLKKHPKLFAVLNAFKHVFLMAFNHFLYLFWTFSRAGALILFSAFYFSITHPDIQLLMIAFSTLVH